MKRELAYFEDFLANPGSYKVKEFYEYIHEWIEYVTDHKDEFNYLEDEEWREVKERVLEALEIQEDRKDEYYYLQERLDEVDESDDWKEKVEAQREWLDFMRLHQEAFEFSDEQIADLEEAYGKFYLACLDYDASHERVKRSRARYEKHVADLDEYLAGYQRKTGKRLVLTSLTRKKGN